MSVILVVEPDSRHAAQVAAMARKHLTAELVIADSAGHAVAAMADRVPDVLLMSSLLSRQDEATLAAWLRDLGPAAAHVQELRIPILAATPTRVPERRGVLSGFRRNRETAATDGCALEEFARQVSAYVGFAYAYRGIAEPVVGPPPPCHQVEPAPVPPEPDVVRIETAAVDGVGDEEDRRLAIAFDDACEEPALPRRIWALTPIADHKAWLVAAAELPQAAPEPTAIAEPRPESESLAVAEQEPVAIAAAASPASEPTTKRKGRRRGKIPAQDGGGLFDPDQCGFAALVAKLHEITEKNHAEKASADTTVRLIAY